jgi:hypothetical protein
VREPVVEIGRLGRRRELEAGAKAMCAITPLDLCDQGIGIANRPCRVRQHRVGAAGHACIEAQAPAFEPGVVRRWPSVGGDILEQPDAIKTGGTAFVLWRRPVRVPMAASEG